MSNKNPLELVLLTVIGGELGRWGQSQATAN
jgi:hypothetical protein